MNRPELVSPNFRLAFREFCVSLPLRQIDSVFQANGFEPKSLRAETIVSGARRTRVEEYYAGIDWASRENASRFLRVVSYVLSQTYVDKEEKDRLIRTCREEELHIDGFVVSLPQKPVSSKMDIEAGAHGRGGVKNTKALQIFISYSSDDKDIAGQLKRGLERFGIECFCAHDDIEPSAEWQTVILSELKNCDVFMPLLTENFSSSDYTDQETGIALGLNKRILPVKIGKNPHGFISKFQALAISPQVIGPACRRIFDTLCTYPEYSERMKTCAIRAFSNSGSFIDANSKSELLLRFDDFSREQLREIFGAAAQNGQIFRSWGAQSNLRTLAERFRDKIDAGVLAAYEQAKSGA